MINAKDARETTEKSRLIDWEIISNIIKNAAASGQYSFVFNDIKEYQYLEFRKHLMSLGYKVKTDVGPVYLVSWE